ncbi:hypothetical protein JXA32_11705 [Candidatus Sumerlaeota bacterium]|nr:hypothetical protein [Candidatus Sumerlaeota bacterium]
MNDMFTAVSGAIAQERRLGRITHNLANAHTSGFRRDTMRFVAESPDFAFQDAWPGQVQNVDHSKAVLPSSAIAYPVLQPAALDLTPGELSPTGDPLDLAISSSDPAIGGNAFFELQSTQGKRLTRSSNFIIGLKNGEKMLLASGSQLPVLGQGGHPVTLNSDSFEVTKDGGVWQDGKQIARLKLVAVADTVQLRHVGENALAYDGEEKELHELELGETTVVLQGYEESSNVSVIDELMRMIQVQRNFDAMTKSIQTSDETRTRLITNAMS